MSTTRACTRERRRAARETAAPNRNTGRSIRRSLVGACVASLTTANSASTSRADDCPKPGTDHVPRSELVEVNGTTGSVVVAPARNVVPEDRGLLVCVRDVEGTTITAEWGGVRGIAALSVNDERSDPAAKTLRGVPTIEPTILRFAPRRPGSADLTVYRTVNNVRTVATRLELEVDPLYWGAVRLGLGSTFGNWRSYQIATFAGSRQAEVRESSSPLAFELVAGFAPYLIDLAWHGRSETGGRSAYGAPFVGFGLLGAQATGIEALSSVHFGVEFEFANSFSIATTFVMHRTQKLAEGYQAGSPIASGMTLDGITETAWRPGFAVVVNASPGFLQFATGDRSKTQDKSDASLPSPTDDRTGTGADAGTAAAESRRARPEKADGGHDDLTDGGAPGERDGSEAGGSDP
jgi:hypothetical protein